MIQVKLTDSPATLVAEVWINPQQITCMYPRIGRPSHTNICFSDGQAFFVQSTIRELLLKFDRDEREPHVQPAG